MSNKMFEVEKTDVVKIDDSNFTFGCKDEENAEWLCEFLNITIYPVNLDLQEWNYLLDELSSDEKELKKLKKYYDEKSNEMIVNVDFNTLYGKNNKDVRKAHIQKALKDVVERKEELELKIDANKRRITFLKASVYAKIEIMRVLNPE